MTLAEIVVIGLGLFVVGAALLEFFMWAWSRRKQP